MTDFRALCAELLKGLDENRHPEVRYPGHLRIIMANARAALAQPEPQGPTDEELLKLIADKLGYELTLKVDFQEVYGSTEEMVSLLRVVLARWGRPAIEPVPVSERPWEREGWCDANQKCWVWNEGNCRWWEFIDSRMISFSHDDYTHCLPCWALPVPNSNSFTPRDQ